MTLSDIQTLYDFNFWAKKRILEVVETVPHEQLMKDLGSSHGGIHGTLVHIMGAEEIWLKRWKGEPTAGLRKPEEFPTLESLTNHWAMVEMNTMGYCHMLKTDEELLHPFTYSDLKGNQHSQPLYQAMQHVVNHSSYHRGQIVTMLRQSGVKPVSTDLIAYYRQKNQ